MAGINISVVIPTCKRADFLGRTLESLLPHVVRHHARILIGENCNCGNPLINLVRDLQKRIPQLDVTLHDLTDGQDIVPSGPNMLRAIDTLYGYVETKYIFHCEDDWIFSEADFMTASLQILEVNDDVKIVRLTGNSISPKADPSQVGFVSGSGAASPVKYYLSKYGGPGGSYGAFTFNPGLRRLADYQRFHRPFTQFASEADISKYSQKIGHREAILEQTFVRHIGGANSLFKF